MVEVLYWIAAVLAGTGGCWAGIRAADWVNVKLGRVEQEQQP